MRILVITPYFFPHPGGSQQYIEGLYTAVKKLRLDIQVDVICYNTDHQKTVEQHGIFTIYRVPCIQLLYGQFAIPNFFAIRRLIHKLKRDGKTYDIVNAHTRFFESSWWAPTVAKSFNAKSIFTDHCASHPWHPSAFVRFIAKQVDTIITPLIAKKYNKITVVSEATKRFLESLGVHVDAVIPCGIDVQNNLKHSDEKSITVGFVGRMIPSKHPEIALEVIKKLIEDGQKIRGVIVGGGPLLDRLKSNEHPSIVFTGPLSHTETQKQLTNIDILLHPSVHHEGLPMILLEAGKAGCAVICSPQGGSTEVVIDDETGIVTNPTKDDIYTETKRLLSEPALIKQFGTALNKKVRSEFNWEIIARKYLKVLEQIK